MALRDTVKLIPRNNWDYGVGAVATATSGIYHHVSRPPNVSGLLQQDPIWANAGAPHSSRS